MRHALLMVKTVRGQSNLVFEALKGLGLEGVTVHEIVEVSTDPAPYKVILRVLADDDVLFMKAMVPIGGLEFVESVEMWRIKETYVTADTSRTDQRTV